MDPRYSMLINVLRNILKKYPYATHSLHYKDQLKLRAEVEKVISLYDVDDATARVVEYPFAPIIHYIVLSDTDNAPFILIAPYYYNDDNGNPCVSVKVAE